METRIFEIAERIRSLREILAISPEEMAGSLGMSTEDYLQTESGEEDFTFTFLFKCAEKFGVDLVELVTGENPKLSFYTVIRKDKGLPIKRRKGFTYQHLAYRFHGRMAEPFLVTAPYLEEEQDKPIALSYHEGQEFDYILKGTLKVVMESHEELLHEGDAIFYDSGHGHGMIATGGEDCILLAVVLKEQETEEQGNG